MPYPSITILSDQTVYAPPTDRCSVLVTITPLASDQRLDSVTRNLSLVLDRSGSMQGTKIKAARDAACRIVDQLLPTDRLSIVAFDNQVEIVCPCQPVTDKTEIKSKISRITAGGNTALHQAWVRGAMEVNRFSEVSTHNRILLVTDGQANVGETNPATLIGQAREMVVHRLSTSTIGIGNDFNEELLRSQNSKVIGA